MPQRVVVLVAHGVVQSQWSSWNLRTTCFSHAFEDNMRGLTYVQSSPVGDGSMLPWGAAVTGLARHRAAATSSRRSVAILGGAPFSVFSCRDQA